VRHQGTAHRPAPSSWRTCGQVAVLAAWFGGHAVSSAQVHEQLPTHDVLQGPLAVAGAQLRLLRLLGTPSADLAGRLGRMASSEARQLSAMLGDADQGAKGTATSAESAASPGWWQIRGSTEQQLPLRMSIGQLIRVAAVINGNRWAPPPRTSHSQIVNPVKNMAAASCAHADTSAA